MFSRFQLLQRYIHYYLTALNGKGHGIHSPFIFHFVTRILNDKKEYPPYQVVEDLRSKLLKSNTKIQVEDFGAGSTVSKSNIRSIMSIAHNAAKPKKFSQLLFRMVKHYEPKTILELGTSLGITTSYLSFADPSAQVITMEGAASIAEVAYNNFQNLGLKNINLIKGNFEETLNGALLKIPTVDFAFIDGNHRQEPTEKYFEQLLAKTNNDSVLIFDDIHWSKEMEAAWKTIKNHPSVRCSVDLFFIGIVFFRKEFTEKQHFVVRF